MPWPPVSTIRRLVHSFSDAKGFAAELTGLSMTDALVDGRFPARNCRLETTLPRARIASYLPGGDLHLPPGDPLDRMDAWNGHHDAYLKAQVASGSRAAAFKAADSSTPETFRIRHDLDEYGHLDDRLDLVRVEDLRSISRAAGVSEDELAGLARRVGRARRDGKPAADAVRDLDDLLLLWHETGGWDNRPIFAGFWNDARRLLSNPTGGWAEELRDRLGLLGYDPGARLRRSGVEIVVFRYEAAMVPRVPGSELRFAARPTVLDGALGPAFCTSPAGSGRGSALDLCGRDGEPWQEIVHPAVRFEARHVWAAGTIASGVPSGLAAARGLHYTAVCVDGPSWFQELVEDVDGDLI